jgi:hypothetical protein
VFGVYYLDKHSGRQLTWHSSMESCTLKAQFDSGAKELLVSVHQACVLLLFNSADTLSFSAIHSKTAMPLPDLRRTLQSLALGKVRPPCMRILPPPHAAVPRPRQGAPSMHAHPPSTARCSPSPSARCALHACASSLHRTMQSLALGKVRPPCMRILPPPHP